MIEAIPKSVWHDLYQIRQDDQVLANLDARAWRKRELVVGAERYLLYRERWWGAFVLEQERKVLARAVKGEWRKAEFALELGAGRLTLRRTSIEDRRFGVFDGAREVGTIHRSSPTNSRRVQIELPSRWPLPEQVFVFWLALGFWMHEEAYKRRV